MYSRHDEAQKILIHDIKNHLNTIAHLSADGESPAIEEYIHNLNQTISLRFPVMICDHPLLNTILARYMSICDDNKIDFSPDIRHNTVHFLSDNDITSLFCNLLDNAVEAASGVGKPYITLSVSRPSDSGPVIIKLVNSCAHGPVTLHGRLLTTKPDRHYHGIGMRSIYNTVSHYGGEINYFYDESANEFHTTIAFIN